MSGRRRSQPRPDTRASTVTASMAKLVLSSFVMLAVTVGPLSAAVVFVGLTAGATDAERRSIAIRGVSIATVVLVLFALGGGRFLDLLQVSTAAFQLAGGLLLTLAAIDLILSRPSGLSSITPAESREARVTPDIAVFPLAIPLIAGPGAMTAVVLLMQHAALASIESQSCWCSSSSWR